MNVSSALPMPGYAFCKFPYDRSMVEEVKRYPGRRWNEAFSIWEVPEEIVPILRETLARVNPAFSFHRHSTMIRNDRTLSEFQSRAVHYAHTRCGLLVVADREVCRPLAVEYAELCNETPVCILTDKAHVGEWKVPAGVEVHVYNKLPSVVPQHLILDEVHLLKSYKTERTKAVRALRAQNPLMRVLALCPVKIEAPDELHTIHDLIRPGGFGWFPAFRERYYSMRRQSFGTRSFVRTGDPLEETQAELQMRLNYWTATAELTAPVVEVDEDTLAAELRSAFDGECIDTDELDSDEE